jgi:hypothetical protein
MHSHLTLGVRGVFLLPFAVGNNQLEYRVSTTVSDRLPKLPLTSENQKKSNSPGLINVKLWRSDPVDKEHIVR